MKLYLLPLLLLIYFSAKGQDSLYTGKVTMSAYMEAYYGIDETGAMRKERPDFLYNHTSINRPALNLAFLKASYGLNRFRMNMAFMTGTYAAKNLAAEDPFFRNLFEANFGVALDRNERLWLDVGVMPSHIGMESAVGWENATLTRCFVSENSPYYESGFRLSWTSREGNWRAALLGLNGWQRITVDEGILPGGGTQLTYEKGKFKINYSTFAGDVSADNSYLIRLYQNLYASYKLHDRFQIFGGLDLGLQQTPGSGSNWKNWYSWFTILRYNFTERATIAVRAEQFVDDGQLLVKINHAFPETGGGTSLYGWSLNGDYKYNNNLMFRFEIKQIGSSNEQLIRVDQRILLKNYFGATIAVCAGF
jgi:hypothetical protein